MSNFPVPPAAAAPSGQALVSALREAAALVGPEGAVVAYNRALVSFLGAPPATLGDLPAAERAVAAGGAAVGFAARDRAFEVCAIVVEPGFVLFRYDDVTDRRHTSDALQASNETLQALVTAAPVAVLAVDTLGAVTLWNAAAEVMFGWSSAEMRGQSYALVVPDEDRPQFAVLLRRVLGGEGFSGVEARRVRRDGQHFPVRISTAPLHDGGGRVVGAMALLEDLSAEQRLLAQMREAERMELVGRLAGGIAHDFNNLLAVILGSCDLLESPSPGEHTAVRVAEIRRAGERAAELTRQLLAFSRRQVLRSARLDVAEICREVVSMLARILGDEVRVVFFDPEEALFVEADHGELVRVLLNLSVNARDAMPEGGVLTLACRRVRADGPGPDPVELSVSDTGQGIAAAVLPHIFEPFYTTKELGRGTGLGLAMVHGVVHQSGGEIHVETSGQGTTFRVRLPASDAAVEVVPEKQRFKRQIGDSQPPVLLVEDDRELRATLVQVLGVLGYPVVAVESGAEALRCVAEKIPFEVVLTDVVMPEMSGRELVDALLNLRPGLRALYMSGYTNDEVLRRGILTSDASFLQKPFSLDQLAERLRMVCLPGPSSLSPVGRPRDGTLAERRANAPIRD